MADNGTVKPLNHLIVVCCHAIYAGGPKRGFSENEWLIEEFQKGETPTFIKHVRTGLKELAGDPGALLAFSGGSTKKPRTSLSEGQSYLNLAKDNNYYQDQITISNVDPARVIAEEHATDSYQNVLFSLLKFHSHTGVYPQRVTIITHEFKRARFLECHFPAVGLKLQTNVASTAPTYGATVIGINPPPEISPLELLVEGEKTRGIGPWRRDLYGVGHELSGKRAKRGWFPGMEANLFINNGLEEVVEQLVCWDGGTGNQLFPRIEELPWFYRKSG